MRVRDLIPLEPSHEYNSGRRRHEPAAPVPHQQPQRPQFHAQHGPPAHQPVNWGGPPSHHAPPFANGMNRLPPGQFAAKQGQYPSNGYPGGPSTFISRPSHHQYPTPSPSMRPFPGSARSGIPPPPFILAALGIPKAPFPLAGPPVASNFRPPHGVGGMRRGPPVHMEGLAREEIRRRAADEGLPYG